MVLHKGVARTGASACRYPFTCHRCKKPVTINELRVGVAPWRGCKTQSWLEFCGNPCVNAWDADPTEDPALRRPPEPPRRQQSAPAPLAPQPAPPDPTPISPGGFPAALNAVFVGVSSVLGGVFSGASAKPQSCAAAQGGTQDNGKKKKKKKTRSKRRRPKNDREAADADTDSDVEEDEMEVDWGKVDEDCDRIAEAVTAAAAKSEAMKTAIRFMAENIMEHSEDAKYRQINVKAGGKIAALLAAMGFKATAGSDGSETYVATNYLDVATACAAVIATLNRLDRGTNGKYVRQAACSDTTPWLPEEEEEDEEISSYGDVQQTGSSDEGSDYGAPEEPAALESDDEGVAGGGDVPSDDEEPDRGRRARSAFDGNGENDDTESDDDEDESDGSVPRFEPAHQAKALFSAAKRIVTDMPRCNFDGQLQWKNGDILSEADIRSYLKENASHRDKSLSVDAHISAEACRPGGVWTQEAMEQARDFFLVGGVPLIPVGCLELYHRRSIALEEIFQVKDANGKVTGFKSFCYLCMSNKFVYPLSSFTTSSTTDQRCFHGKDLPFQAFGQEFVCNGPACEGVCERYRNEYAKAQAKRCQPCGGVGGGGGGSASGVHANRDFLNLSPDDFEQYLAFLTSEDVKRASMGKNFSPWTTAYQQKLPLSIKLLVAGNIELPKGGCSEGLSEELLNSTTSLQDFCKRHVKAYALSERQRQVAFDAFAKAEYERDKRVIADRAKRSNYFHGSSSSSNSSEGAASDKPLAWPPWLHICGKGPLGPPTIKNIRSYFHASYNRLEGLLYQEMENEVPGQFGSSDGMYRLTGRTGNPLEGVIVFVLSERGIIVRWFVLQSEAKEHQRRAFEQWVRVLKTQTWTNPVTGETMNAYEALCYWNIDTCCNGLDDPSKHWMYSVFTYLVSLKGDGWHLTDRVVKAGGNQHEKRAVGEEFGRIIRTPFAPDLAKAIAYLKKLPKNKGATNTELQSKALSSLKPHIRKEGRPRKVMKPEIEAAGAKWEAKRRAWLAKPKPRGSPPFFRGQLASGNPSTLAVVENLVKCCEKGCCEDHVGIEQTYFSRGVGAKTGLVSWKKKADTGKNEGCHPGVNTIVHTVSSIKSKLLQPRVQLHLTHYNRAMRIANGDQEQYPNLPFWQQHLLQEHADATGAAEILPGVRALAPRPPQDIREAHGFEYSDAANDVQLQRALNASAPPPSPLPGLQAAAAQPVTTAATLLTALTPLKSNRPVLPGTSSGLSNRSTKHRSPSVSSVSMGAPKARDEVDFAFQCVGNAMAASSNSACAMQEAARLYNATHFASQRDASASTFPPKPTNEGLLKKGIDASVAFKKEGSIRRGGAASGASSSSSHTAASRKREASLDGDEGTASGGAVAATNSSAEENPEAAAVKKARKEKDSVSSAQRRLVAEQKARKKVRGADGAPAVPPAELLLGDVDGLTVIEMGAYLESMSELDGAVVKVGRANKTERAQKLKGYFSANSCNSYTHSSV